MRRCGELGVSWEGGREYEGGGGGGGAVGYGLLRGDGADSK